MEDVAPELLKRIRAEFDGAVEQSSTLKGVEEKILKGTATYAEANQYAIEVGKILANAYKNNISSDVLPDGKLYYNIADRVISPTMRNNFELISKVSAQIQKILNDNAGIGINAIQPDMNMDRVEGIVNRVSGAENYDDVSWILQEPIINFSQSIVDAFVKENSEFQGKAGLLPKIVRKLSGGCCEWCSRLAGTYTYPDVPDDVYRRHQRCKCTVEYDPGTGKRQNVHTKEWHRQEKDDIINERKILGLFANNVQIKGVSNHVIVRMNERKVDVTDIIDAIENPLSITPIKTDEKGRKSFKQIGEKATIAINPETGVLTTVHKTHTKLVKKLKGEKS
ncbi:MAG: DUF4258 domain-containing protein [Roseburia sp.]|nr:DUF4258 domain-containing protein [Roseburia sp.]